VTQLTGGSHSFDRDGLLARNGTVHRDWLERLLQHPYYERQPPKTTGRELFSAAMARQLVAEGRKHGYTAPDIVATITALTAYSIHDSYLRFAPAGARIGEVIIAGGGVHNPTLVEMLRDLVAPIPVLTQEEIGFDSDYKEAFLFALLAHETWYNRPGNLPSLTGAQSRVVLGQITPGANYAGLVRRTLV
jgi:anhydro-N-acetylmuramic acid kinase